MILQEFLIPCQEKLKAIWYYVCIQFSEILCPWWTTVLIGRQWKDVDRSQSFSQHLVPGTVYFSLGEYSQQKITENNWI